MEKLPLDIPFSLDEFYDWIAQQDLSTVIWDIKPGGIEIMGPGKLCMKFSVYED